MTIDELSNLLLKNLYDQGGQARSMDLISSGPYTSFIKPSELWQYLTDHKLVSMHRFSDEVFLSQRGRLIVESGGWLNHLDFELREEQRLFEAEIKGALGSHRSGRYAVAAFWLSIVLLLWSIIDFFWGDNIKARLKPTSKQSVEHSQSVKELSPKAPSLDSLRDRNL